MSQFQDVIASDLVEEDSESETDSYIAAIFSKQAYETSLAKYTGLSNQIVKAAFGYFLDCQYTQWEMAPQYDAMRNLLAALHFSVFTFNCIFVGSFCSVFSQIG